MHGRDEGSRRRRGASGSWRSSTSTGPGGGLGGGPTSGRRATAVGGPEQLGGPETAGDGGNGSGDGDSGDGDSGDGVSVFLDAAKNGVIANLKASYSDLSVIIISKVLYNLGLRWDTIVVD